MKRVLGILAGITLTGLIVVSVVALAQQPQTTSDGNVVYKRARAAQGPDGAPPPPPPGDMFVFMASEMNFEGKPVKGAPYSAEAVTETTQTLGDGNRIVNKSTSSLYRDSEGRTRREQTVRSIGPLGNGGEPLQTIFINDPVAGVSFALDSRTHIARKSVPFRFERMAMPATATRVAPGAAEGSRFNLKVESAKGEGGYVIAQTAPLAGPPPPGASGPEGQFNIRTEGGGGGTSTFVFTRKADGMDKNVVTESLGKQLFEGVEAEGTRTTITIPAGDIGNERPIEMVNERWYSPELQMVIMSRHSDPRTGETVYRLTNISRTEPAKSLFEVPGDYTVKEGMPAPPAPAVYVRKPGSPN